MLKHFSFLITVRRSLLIFFMETTSAKFSLKDAGFQIFGAVIAHSLAIHAGINMAFSTIVLPDIMIHNSTVQNDTLDDKLYVDKNEASWIASIVTIAIPVGSLLSGALMDKFGRKKVCLLTAASLIVAWILTATVATQYYLLLVARAFAGFGAGLSTVGLVYVSEISHASIRPMLLSLNSTFVSFGILLTTLLGHLLNWWNVAWSCAFLALASFFAVLILPESPVWISNISQRDSYQSSDHIMKILKWLYRKPQFIEEELCALNLSKLNSKISPESPDILSQDESNLLLKINKNTNRIWKPVILLLGLFFLQQFSGGYIVIFYAIQIFQAAGSLKMDEWTCLILLGTIRFSMAIVSCFLSRTVGRRTLLISSAGGMSLSMLIAATLSFVPAEQQLPSIQIVCILAFVCFSSFGFLVIPWTLIGELLPHRIRGKGSGLMICFAYIVMFFTIKMFLNVLDTIGLGFLFLNFSFVSLVSIFYVYFFIPETLGKTFEEIEEYF